MGGEIRKNRRAPRSYVIHLTLISIILVASVIMLWVFLLRYFNNQFPLSYFQPNTIREVTIKQRVEPVFSEQFTATATVQRVVYNFDTVDFESKSIEPAAQALLQSSETNTVIIETRTVLEAYNLSEGVIEPLGIQTHYLIVDDNTTISRVEGSTGDYEIVDATVDDISTGDSIIFYTQDAIITNEQIASVHEVIVPIFIEIIPSEGDPRE